MGDDGVVFASSVLIQLCQTKDLGFQEHLCNDATSTENVHGPCHLGRLWRGGSRGVESLGGNVAGSSARGVEEVRKVAGVVVGQHDGLEGGRKVCQVQPVPRGHEHILSLYVAVVNVAGMAVAQSAEQLEGEPFFLNVLEERSVADAVVERAVHELADEVSVGLCFDDALEAEGVGDGGKSFSLFYTTQKLALLSAMTGWRGKHTYDLLLVLVELDVGEWLDEQLDEHDCVLVAGPDALHEPRITDAPLVLDILQLRNVDAGRARRGRGEREALAHGG